MVPFKQKFPLEHRLKLVNQAKDYPGYVPVIFEDFTQKICQKYLVEDTTKLSYFLFEVQHHKKIKNVYLLVGDMIPKSNESLGVLYNNYKDSDGLLYIEAKSENSLG